MPKFILIVDDNETVRTALRRFLEAETSFEVCGDAVDGLDALVRRLAYAWHRASLVGANASSQSRVPRERLIEVAKLSRTIQEYLTELERQNPVADSEGSSKPHIQSETFNPTFRSSIVSPRHEDTSPETRSATSPRRMPTIVQKGNRCTIEVSGAAVRATFIARPKRNAEAAHKRNYVPQLLGEISDFVVRPSTTVPVACGMSFPMHTGAKELR